MKKLLGIVVLGLLWSNIVYGIEYCEDYNKTRKPLEPATFISVVFLELELKCLGKKKKQKYLKKKELS